MSDTPDELRRDEYEKRMNERAEKILDVFEVKFRTNPEWSEPRCNTTGGTKSREGAIRTIRAILEDQY